MILLSLQYFSFRMKQSSIAYMITNKMPKKEKILILHKQLGEYFCSQAEKIGLEPIHFYSKEWGDILEFKVNIWTKCENIFRRILFKDKTFIDRKYREYHQKIDIKRLKSTQNFSGLKEFLEKPYYEIDEKIVNKYGVENWLKYVLDIEPHQKIDLPKLWKD